ncbi:MAG TPA: ABC transporter ATP-binding protein [Gemmataceae bacterium]|jgi:ATP-binding cassette subfamily B protein|nr:ABC transporter ATP-binding protein [Gemmataceae bacterium]
MKTKADKNGIGAELRLIAQRGRKVWSLVPGRHKFALGGAAVIMALTSASNTALPLLLGSLVDAIQLGTDQRKPRNELFEAALWVLGTIAVVYVVREGLHIVRRFLVENACTLINRDIGLRLIKHTMKMDLGTLAHDKVGALHGRIFRSIDGLVRFLRLAFLDFFPAIVTGLFALTAALFKQPLLGLVMVGVIPISVLLTIRQLITQKGVRLQLMRDCEEIDGAVVEQLGGLEYIRIANTVNDEMLRLRDAMEKRRRLEMGHHFAMSLFGCGKALNEGFFHIVVLAVATYYALQGTLSYGDVLTFSILFVNVTAPLNEIHRVIDEGHESSLRVGDLLDMLAEPVDASFATKTVISPQLAPGQAAIVVEDLRAEYTTPAGERKRALDGVSLTIKHGETIGIAGPSGGGKSSWVKCLLRLTHPCAGQVTLGGVPLESLARADLARLVGYVGQNPFVFSGTIAANIAYGNGPVGAEDIERVARLANLHEEIMAMPGGYQARVSERGLNLSGGQRQRLAIARILLKQAPILILDEATSALDNISERHVQRALGLTRDDRTTILVAHRLSTLRDADRILVFEDGRIVEIGDYDALVQQGGIFTQLVMSAENGIGASELSPEIAAVPVAR